MPRKTIVIAAALSCGLLSEVGARAGQPSPSNAKPSEAALASVRAHAAEAFGLRPDQVEVWRRSLVTLPRPSNGCFTASYPERHWRTVPCKLATVHKAYLPNVGAMTRIDTVGGSGPDFTATVAGNINQSEGSFDSASGITATGTYTLQLNTDFFQTNACNAASGGKNGNCRGWEQFVYNSSGSAFMQYWLIRYGPVAMGGQPDAMCPVPRHSGCDGQHVWSDGWCPFNLGNGFIYCAVNAGSEPSGVASKSLSSVGSLKLSGKAASGGSNDAIIFTDSGTLHTASGDNRFPDLSSAWAQSEFNVFGDGGGSAVAFNSGANLRVRNVVLSGSNAGPGCSLRSFTGESSNLTLANSVPVGSSPTPGASIVFDQVNPAPAGAMASCAEAVSWGDTHLTTVGGLAYDFQATGDYLLLRADPEFTVQARQVSGAPTWPDASVNKAIGVTTGRNRVAICLGGSVLLNGRGVEVGDGRSRPLPGGGALARRGDTYIVLDPRGHSVRATLHPTNIDVTVGLGRWPMQVSGLLASQPGAHSTATRLQVPATGVRTGALAENERVRISAISARNGATLRAPFDFRELYGHYRLGWQVSGRSVLDDCGRGVEAAAPRAPFTVRDLPRDKIASTQAICTSAGVKPGPILDACMLDAAVIGPEGVRAYRTRIVPRPMIFADIKRSPYPQ